MALEAGGWVLIEIYRYMIESLLRQDRGDDAQQLAEFAARNLPEQDVYARATLLAAQALVSTERGERTAASSAFAEALRLFEAQQMHVDLGETRMAFAQALVRFGEDGAARTELVRARAQFARMGADGMVERIDAALQEMRGGTDPVGPPETS
jgi:hypothetical protein